MSDWEFMYAAQTPFILDPPWWLLLDLAETWFDGIDNWRDVYDTRLKTWISAMKRAEIMESMIPCLSRCLPTCGKSGKLTGSG